MTIHKELLNRIWDICTFKKSKIKFIILFIGKLYLYKDKSVKNIREVDQPFLKEILIANRWYFYNEW